MILTESEKILDFGFFFPLLRLLLCLTLKIFRREKTRQEMKTCRKHDVFFLINVAG